MRLRLVGALVPVLVLALAGDSSATFPGRNGPIVFEGRGGIRMVPPRGGDAQRAVLADPQHSNHYSPAVSPDGQRIAFYLDATGAEQFPDEIAIAPVGGEPTGLNLFGRDPAFAGPSGDRIVFEKGTKLFLRGGGDLAVADADGSGVEVIDELDQKPALEPAVSPGGKSVVYCVGRDQDHTRLALIGIDGGKRRFLTGADDGAAANPSFSPDGRHIVFEVRGDHPGVAIVGRRGGRAKIVVPELGDTDPVFSPDGRRIAYLDEAEHGVNSVIVTADLHGGHRDTVTQAKLDGDTPDWSVR